MMEAARTSETSVDIQLRTRQYIPEDSELYTRRRENFKSHIILITRIYIDTRICLTVLEYISDIVRINTVFEISPNTFSSFVYSVKFVAFITSFLKCLS
jgi:hypothetical protein